MAVAVTEQQLGELCWLVVRGPAREATIVSRGADPVTLPLADLAHGTPLAA